MKRLRLFAALSVVISSLFLATPAFADSFNDWTRSYNTNYSTSTDCVQFSYTWGSTSKSYSVQNYVQNVQFAINVQNDITNKIGGNGEVFDSYSIKLEVVDSGVVVDTVTYDETRTKHINEPRTVSSDYSGHVDSVNVTLKGIDNGFWGGYYGPVMCGPVLTVTSVSLPTLTQSPEPQPSLTPDSTPTPAESSTPVVVLPTETSTPTPTPTDSPTTQQPQFPQNSAQGTADEGWGLTLTAPDGYVFDSVYFASYGTPIDYVKGWCHAEVSEQKVSEVFLGQTTGTIGSDNGVFGDPCGGTYKHLQVVLTYKAIVPTVVPTPEPPVDPNPPVVPPVVVPPVVLPPDPQPPVVVPPVDPPVVPPVVPDPPVVDPPVGPVVEPKPPVEIPVVGPPPVVLPPKPIPAVPEVPVAKPVEPSQPPIASVDPSTIDPQTLSPKEVAQLQEVAAATLATEPEGSPAYTQALEQLAVAAKADDIVVDEQLASTPVIGAAVVGVVNAINAIGNIGADMSPAHRDTAKKEVVAAVVATGAAISAATGAATGAASVSSSGSTSSSRRKE